MNHPPSIIYQTKSNITIENGLFHKQTNTIILLIDHLNQTYSLLSLNAHDNIYKSWLEKSNHIFYPSYIYLTLGQRYLYILNNRTMLLQIYKFPLKSTTFKENSLLNLPKNQTIINYVIDEKFESVWILFENIHYQLYTCELRTYSCHLIMNITNLYKPIELYINWRSHQLFIYSINYLITFEYNQNQTDYLNFTQQTPDQFFTICEQNNRIEYVSINYTNQRQVCYQSCQDFPLILNDTSRIHIIQRLTTSSNILYCSKQRKIIKIVLLILILIDIAILLSFIGWLTYQFSFQSTLEKNKNLSDNGTIWTIEKSVITYF